MIAIYARQSVDKKDSISIEKQIADCECEAKREKYEVYIDKGFSGKNLERDEFKRMMKDIRDGKINKVIVYRLDRISRSVLDFVNVYEEFKKHNVEFVSCIEKFDTTTDMGEAMLKIAVVFAELERKTIQQRVIDAYDSRSKAGFYMGGRVAYGFQLEPITIGGIKTSHYKPIDEEIKQLKDLFELYSKPATSLADIVRYFNDKGMKKTRGIEWSTSRLTELLRNPIYVKADMDIYNFYKSRQTEIVNDTADFIGTNGCYLYTRNVSKTEGQDKDKDKDKNKSKIKSKSKNMSHYSNMTLVIAPHEGIIDSETFIRCRLKAEQNVQIPNGRRAHTTWVSGKLKCAACGYAMRYNKWVGKTTENEYYICSEAGKKCTGVGAIHKDTIESVVLEQLKLKIKSIKIEQNQPNPNTAKINAIKAEITVKNNEIDAILENFKYASQTVIERMNKDVEKLTDEITDLNNEIIKLEMSKNNRNQLDTKAIETIFKYWDKVSKEDRQKVVDILISKVLVSKEKIEILWKI